MAGAGPPARPANRLRQELVRALGGALVGEVEGHIRGDDPDQRDRRNVEALGHEARPDEDIEAPLGHVVEDPGRGPSTFDDVTVEPGDADIPETRPGFHAPVARSRPRDTGSGRNRRLGQRLARGVARPQ